MISGISNSSIYSSLFQTQGSSQSNSLAKVLAENEIVSSLSEARRLIAQGGVTVNGEKISDTAFIIEGTPEALVKAGKRKFLKVVFKPKGA